MLLFTLLVAAFELPVPLFVPSGDARVKVSARPVGNAAVIEFHNRSKLLKRDRFSILAAEGAQGLALLRLDTPGLPAGLVLAVAHQVGADGVNTESALYRIRSGRVQSVWNNHRFLRFSQEALCFGQLGSHGIGVAEIEMDDASGCVMCDHLYFATVGTWSEGKLAMRKLGRTKKKYATGEAAAREFGIDCKDAMVTLLASGAS